jgi:hypothetical protein
MLDSIDELNIFFSLWDAPIKALSFESDKSKKNKKVNFKCTESGCEFNRPLADVIKNIKNNEQRPFCTVCSSVYFHEQKVRFILQQMLNTKFSKARPHWLKYEGCKLPLELDGLSQDGKIAFEYQGEQHHRAFGHITEADLQRTQERDEIKVKLCKEKSVKLIVVDAEEFGGDIMAQIDKALEQLKIYKKSEVINWGEFKIVGKKTLAVKAEIHALNMGYTLTFPEPLTDNAKDFIFKCPDPDHENIQARQIDLDRRRPSCRQCGHEERGRKEKAANAKTDDEMAKNAMECDPPMELQRWAGIDRAGARLYKCTYCDDVAGYKDLKVIKGRGQKICINCGLHKKPRIQLFRVMEHAHMLGGRCLSTSQAKLTKKSKLKFKCFNSEHSEFELTPAQLLDSEMWCDQPPCNQKKKKKAKIRSVEIKKDVEDAFPGLKFIGMPVDGQNSHQKFSCGYCQNEVKGANGAALTYKSLRIYGELKCAYCDEDLGSGWKDKSKA